MKPDKKQRQAGRQAGQDEQGRVAAMMRAATPPGDVDIPVAPGRGAFKVVAIQETGITQAGNIRTRRTGDRGAVICDAFEIAAMKAAASKAPPPFTARQIAAGRLYRDLVEAYEGSATRGSNFDARTSGGTPGGGFSEAQYSTGCQVDRMVAAIGKELALIPRRQRGSVRRIITVRGLVDRFCLADAPLSQILTAFGWSTGEANRVKLKAALCAALDRMAI